MLCRVNEFFSKKSKLFTEKNTFLHVIKIFYCKFHIIHLCLLFIKWVAVSLQCKYNRKDDYS